MTGKATKAPGELRRLAGYWCGLPRRHPVGAAIVLIWFLPVVCLLAWMAGRR
ncbi:hypothetical protein [Streptomyces thermolineatus]|uniref:hypothetical protein n=1 Tax=Streptomyces thermolineatus TaxID=44033 RepID=UPI00384E40D8